MMTPAVLGVVALLRGPGDKVAVVAATPTTTPSRDQIVPTSKVTIRRIDTTGFPNVRVVAMSTRPGPANRPRLFENGRTVADARIERYEAPKGIALVVDTSGSMVAGGRLDAVKDAIRLFAGQLGDADQVAIVGFNNKAEVVQGLTGDMARVSNSVDRLRSKRRRSESALRDGIVEGVRLLEQNTHGLQPNLVIITDGHDTVSSADVATTRANVVSANTSVFAIGIRDNELATGPLDELAAATGGTVQTGEAGDVYPLLRNIDTVIHRQADVSYRSRATDAIDLVVRAGDAQDRVSGIAQGIVLEGTTHRPEVVETRSPPRWLESSNARVVISLLVLVGLALLGYGLLGTSTHATPRPEGEA
jgi:Mg-chelatase subunit ChlD